MPARVANGSSTSNDSQRSSDNETESSQQVIETERSSNIELTAKRVANTTSEAVRTLARRSEAPKLSLKTATRTDSDSLQEAQTFSTDHTSPAIAHDGVPLGDLAGLQKVIVTAERVAASTSGAVLKLGSTFHHQ